MKKMLLFSNERSADDQALKFRMCLQGLNYVNEIFKDHSLGALNAGTVAKILKDPYQVVGDILKSRIPDKDPNTGLKNLKDHILSLMDVPVINERELTDVKNYAKDSLNLFDFGETVTLNEDRLQEYLDKFRYYSDNAEVIEAYNELTEVAEKLTAINDKLNFIPNAHNVGGITHSERLDEIFIITPSGFQITLESFQLATKHLR